MSRKKNRTNPAKVYQEYEVRFGRKDRKASKNGDKKGGKQRANVSMKLRHRSDRKARWRFANAYEIRTLKRSARRAIRREMDKKYIRPWIKDPTFRYQHREYPDAHLMGLPLELRFDILERCLPVPNEAGFRVPTVVTVPWRQYPDLRHLKEEVTKQVARVSCVLPQLRLEMMEVSRRWEKTHWKWDTTPPANAAQQRRAATPIAPSIAPFIVPVPLLPMNSMPSQVFNTTKSITGKRLKKCRFCLERHRRRDQFCPPERRGFYKWRTQSKVWKKKVQEKALKWATRGYVTGTKIVFEQ